MNVLMDGVMTHVGFVRWMAKSSNPGVAQASLFVEVTTAPAFITIGVQHNDGGTSAITCVRNALLVEYKGEIQP